MPEKYHFDLVTTKNGDGGKSTDFCGRCYQKDDLLFAVLGDIDELNSAIGFLKQVASDKKSGRPGPAGLEIVQRKLIELSSLVATDPSSDLYATLKPTLSADVEALEAVQQAMLDSGLDIQPAFVLPGATEASARADLARAICRRAERSVVRFIAERSRPDLVKSSIYLNRLSDFLFILARSLEKDVK